jgi:nucleotide-binding universal stress UspA family protein
MIRRVRARAIIRFGGCAHGGRAYGQLMSAPILAAFNPATGDRGPVAFGLAACRATGAPLIVVAVQQGGSMLDRLTGGEPHEAAPDDATSALVAELAAQDVPAEVRVVDHTTPARGLASAVASLHPELLVVGSTREARHGHVRPGSTAERLLAGAACPVAVVPHRHPPGASVAAVGAAFVPTPEGREALSAAAALARAFGARLRAIMVLDPRHAEEQSPGLMARQHHDVDAEESIDSRHRLEARGELDAAVAELGDGLEVDIDVLFQDPADGIEAASHRVDLLVMGSRAYGPVRAVMLGGVARRVIARAACPVLVLPRGAEAASDALIAATETHATG